MTGSLTSVEGHANLKLACIQHTQNGDIRTDPSIRPRTMTSSTFAQQASPGDASNWVFHLDHKPKIFCNTYAICLTSCLVKHTPSYNYAEWNGTCNWKFRSSIVSQFPELSSSMNIFLYEKMCLKYKKKILTKFFRCRNLGSEIRWLFKEVKKEKASWWTTT